MNNFAAPLQEAHRDKIMALRGWLAQRIIGQEALIDRLVLALLCGGHLLVEGAPGLAKTRAIKELAHAVEGDFHRIQFTPDLLPSDVTGTEIFRPEDGSFRFERGPVFHNLVLADEVNRAPAKVQSALLEAMAERQVSIGRQSFELPELFMVMATQNPIEQEGTYPLPEAQLDRFLMHVKVSFPSAEAELQILELVRGEAVEHTVAPPPRLEQQEIFAARRTVLELHMAPVLQRYIVDLVMATREPPPSLASQIEYGASPRGSIALDQCARAHAWLNNQEFVTPDNLRAIVHDVLRHRLILTFEAEAQGIDPDTVIDELLSVVPAP